MKHLRLFGLLGLAAFGLTACSDVKPSASAKTALSSAEAETSKGGEQAKDPKAPFLNHKSDQNNQNTRVSGAFKLPANALKGNIIGEYQYMEDDILYDTANFTPIIEDNHFTTTLPTPKDSSKLKLVLFIDDNYNKTLDDGEHYAESKDTFIFVKGQPISPSLKNGWNRVDRLSVLESGTSFENIELVWKIKE